jgi:hypothetical protein
VGGRSPVAGSTQPLSRSAILAAPFLSAQAQQLSCPAQQIANVDPGGAPIPTPVPVEIGGALGEIEDLKEPPPGTKQALYLIDKQKQLAATVGNAILEPVDADGVHLGNPG